MGKGQSRKPVYTAIKEYLLLWYLIQTNFNDWPFPEDKKKTTDTIVQTYEPTIYIYDKTNKSILTILPITVCSYSDKWQKEGRLTTCFFFAWSIINKRTMDWSLAFFFASRWKRWQMGFMDDCDTTKRTME